MYSFGCGEGGVLGHGDMHNQLTPKIVESLTDQRIAFITAGCAVIVRRISLSGLSSYCSQYKNYDYTKEYDKHPRNSHVLVALYG